MNAPCSRSQVTAVIGSTWARSSIRSRIVSKFNPKSPKSSNSFTDVDYNTHNPIFHQANTSLWYPNNHIARLAIEPAAAEIAMLPQNYVKLEGKPAQQMVKLMEAVEEHDDTKKVWSNADIEEKEIEASLA